MESGTTVYYCPLCEKRVAYYTPKNYDATLVELELQHHMYNEHKRRYRLWRRFKWNSLLTKKHLVF